MSEHPVVALEAERNLISVMLANPSELLGCELTPENFASESHREIFGAMLSMAGTPIDAVTVSDALQRITGRDWLHTVGTIAANWVSPTLIGGYSRIIKAAHAKRTAIGVANTLVHNVDEPGAVDAAIKALMAIDGTSRRYEWSIQQATKTALNEIGEAAENNGATGVMTGLSDLDRLLGGFHAGDLIVIGARPAMGKTAIAVNCAANSRVPVGFVSTEQGHSQIAGRMIALQGKISVHKMRNGSMGDDDYNRLPKAVEDLSGAKMWINDKRAQNIVDIARQARKWKHAYNIGILFVDYIQRLKVSGKNDNRAYGIGEIVEGLKDLAGELGIPVVALAQINREVEKRDNKRPGMADLKDSGTIEQEADQVITLYRDEVYNSNSEPGIAELIVCKNRHGPTGVIKTAWSGEYMQFFDIF